MSSQLETLQYRFQSEAFPSTELLVASVRVTEAIDEPYSAEVNLRVPEEDADLGMMLGRNATLLIERRSVVRRVCGIVRAVRPRGDDMEAPAVSVEVVPALWTLSLRRDTRMFQEKTAPEILEAVLNEALGPYGRSVQLELRGSYPRREYTLQYQESDLDFAHRLMEEEGIHYTFDHDGETEVMVLRDDNGAFPEATILGGGPVALTVHNLHAVDREGLLTFARTRRSTTTSVAVRELDWTLGGYVVADGLEGEDERGRARESYEHGLGREVRVWSYGAGPRRYQEHDAARQSRLRQEAHRADGTLGHGTGRVIGFAPGRTFELAGHPSVDHDGAYLITRVVHVSRPPRTRHDGSGSADGESYHNQFECIPLATPYRARRRTLKPSIASIQTAVVTGPAGEEIHVDEHGRIKVRFHWDRESPADDTSSCWIRVQQAWAGDGWGFWWVPRIGMEVVVQFIDGDPDRPLVTGAVYDGTNALPYALPDEKTKSTIKSSSSIGGGGFNEFRFEDKAGSEEIFTHAQKDYNEVVEHDHNTLVHHNQTNTVDVDQTQEIGANQTETVHGNQVMTVDGNRTVHVKTSFDETVDGTETRHVAGNVTETFDANEDRVVAGNVTETISGSETRTITGSQAWTIGGNQTLTIGSSSTDLVGGALTETITAGITTITPASIALSSVGGWNVTAAGGITIVAPAGMTVMIPGGNKRADSFHFWLSTEEKKTGGYKLEVVGLTSEIVGLETGFTNYKYEDTGVFIDKGIKLWKKITKGKFSGVVAEFGGPEIDSAQRTHT